MARRTPGPKVGGEIAASDAAALDGGLGLELTSRTTSTKWAYQAVAARSQAPTTRPPPGPCPPPAPRPSCACPGTHPPTVPASSVADDDSPETTANDGAFHYLTTGAVQAPAGVHSVRVRLLLRPASEANAEAAFDDVAFDRTEPPAGDSVPARTVSPAQAAKAASDDAADAASADDPASGPGADPSRPLASLANVRPAPVVLAESQSPDAGGGFSWHDALLAALIGVPLAGIGGIFAQDLYAQSKRGDGSPPD